MSDTMSDEEEGRQRIGPVALAHLAAAMAHEVRNPLNSIAIHCELLDTRSKKGALEAASLAKSLSVMAREVSRIDGILESYLGYAGPLEAERRPIAVAALVRGALAAAHAQAVARGVSLIERLEVADGVTWSLDGPAVTQALELLLSNAIEASPSGAQVELRAVLEEDSGVFEIHDHGEGISGEVMPRVFMLGFSTREGHTGVGLTVARQIIKSHGGSVQVRSKGVGEGTSLHIEIPLD